MAIVFVTVSFISLRRCVKSGIIVVNEFISLELKFHIVFSLLHAFSFAALSWVLQRKDKVT